MFIRFGLMPITGLRFDVFPEAHQCRFHTSDGAISGRWQYRQPRRLAHIRADRWAGRAVPANSIGRDLGHAVDDDEPAFAHWAADFYDFPAEYNVYYGGRFPAKYATYVFWHHKIGVYGCVIPAQCLLPR